MVFQLCPRLLILRGSLSAFADLGTAAVRSVGRQLAVVMSERRRFAGPRMVGLYTVPIAV